MYAHTHIYRGKKRIEKIPRVFCMLWCKTETKCLVYFCQLNAHPRRKKVSVPMNAASAFTHNIQIAKEENELEIHYLRLKEIIVSTR